MKLRRVQCTEAEIIADAPSVQRQAFSANIPEAALQIRIRRVIIFF